MSMREWPDALRAGGVRVVVHPEVNTLPNLGELRDTNLLMHHDASPFGDSPGALVWMIRNWRKASAQCWIDRAGTWHFISFGVAYHAGAVNDVRWSNPRAAGTETDHTTGESWPAAQLDSVITGYALILKHEGKSVDAISFHKNVAVPAGRKQDPDGLDLNTFREAVARRMQQRFAPLPNPESEFLMGLSQYDQELVRNAAVDINNRTAAMLETLTARDPNTGEPLPFTWLAATHNAVGEVLNELRALSARVDELAKKVD